MLGFRFAAAGEELFGFDFVVAKAGRRRQDDAEEREEKTAHLLGGGGGEDAFDFDADAFGEGRDFYGGARRVGLGEALLHGFVD